MSTIYSFRVKPVIWRETEDQPPVSVMHRWEQAILEDRELQAPSEKKRRSPRRKKGSGLTCTSKWGEDACSPASSLLLSLFLSFFPAALTQRSHGWPAETDPPICGERWGESVHLIRSIELTAHTAKWASVRDLSGQTNPKWRAKLSPKLEKHGGNYRILAEFF